MRNTLRVLFAVVAPLAVILGATAQQAKAQSLLFTLTPALREALPGQTITFTGILTNTTNATIFLDNVGATFTDAASANNLSISASAGLPTSILANTFYSGAIFDLTVAPTSTSNQLFGTAVIYGGSVANTFSPLASQNFVVIPEAGTAGLMAATALPLLGAVVVRARRRKSAAQTA